MNSQRGLTCLMSFDCAKLARHYNHGACEDKACQLIMGPSLDQEQLTTFEPDLAVAQIARPHVQLQSFSPQHFS